MKKLFFLISFLVSGILFTATANAATPTLSLSGVNSGDSVEIKVNGDANSGVLFFYQKASGGSYIEALGSTSANGYYSTIISTATYNIMPSSPVYVKVNNQLSATATWPYLAASGGAITLNQTGLVLTVGQTNNLTVNNLGSQSLYLLSNSNPQIANINLSGSQVTIIANTYGQTVATVCVLGTTSNCASVYITVQNSGAQALLFSQTNLTIAYGQSSQVTVLNGITTNGNNAYIILNNSNPSVISASIISSNINLTANNNSGAAAITVCTADMSSCGIINATAGSTSSSTLVFNQTAPTLVVGQTLNVAISGGSSYNISSNSNSTVVAASISSSNLVLIGNSSGSSLITVCSSAGNCNSLSVAVSYASSGQALALSQSSLWLQVGQAVSVTISGGTSPYSFLGSSGFESYFQISLNGNILTLTGVSAGSATVSVCSAGGACQPLSVLVNGVSSSTQLTFSNNNLSLNIGGSTEVSLLGAGGYYLSATTNQNVASVVVTGSKATVSALSPGNASATICQTGGQCGILYIVVKSDASTSTPPAFSQNNPMISSGQSLTIAVSGGSSSSYYISSNSNSTVVSATLSGNTLVLSGKNNGSAVLAICTATNNCSSLAVTISPAQPSNTSNSSNTSTSSTPTNSSTDIVQKINEESESLITGDLSVILRYLGIIRDTTLESSGKTKYLTPLTNGLKLTDIQTNILNYFVVYGTPSTLKLGAGERAGVLSSYLKTYGKLPITLAQWVDVLNIANGRWPITRTATAENQAKSEFKKVYNRAADFDNVRTEQNAIMVIAYGLRFTNRDLSAEQRAISLFKSTYDHAPISALAWNIVRAIAYSGAIIK